MFIKLFLFSVANYFRALALLSKNNLWKYVLIPGIFSLFLVLLLVITGFIFSGDISLFLIDKLFEAESNNTFVEFLLHIFVALVIVILGMLIYRPLALILLAPFLTVLSEKTEKIISNNILQTVSSGFWRDLQRSIRINIRYFLFASFYSLAAVVSGLLPIVGPFLSALLLFGVQAYYGGGGLADIILERRGMPVKERLRFIKDNRPLILGSGAGFLLLLFIPFAGWFIAPGLGTIATTISLAESRL